jgi:cyclic pyranopterin phosphate synthase
MPEEGIKSLSHNEILTYEEIIDLIKPAVKLGINKIRITGGEPLVRKGIIDFVEMVAMTEGITDLSMTTNGILLDRFAIPLAKAGLQRVNISLDTIDPEKYRETTRGGNVEQVFKGIAEAKKAGLYPIKINCVVISSSDEKDARDVERFCRNNNLEVRYIHQMDLMNGMFSVVEGGNGGDCSLCNRLRLTANGKIKPCLFSDLEFDVRELGPEKALEMAVGVKPEKGSRSMSATFYNTGG